MYTLLSKILEQQKNMKIFFIINMIGTAIISGLLLYFSTHVVQTAASTDSISLSLGSFFIFISLFILLEVGSNAILFISLNKKSKEFIQHINKFAVDNDLIHKDSLNITPMEFCQVVTHAKDEKDFEKKLSELLNK